MTIFVGLDDNGDLDVEKIRTYGIAKLEVPEVGQMPSEEYSRFLTSLESACRKYEKRTGKLYGRTEPDTLTFIVRGYISELYTGLTQQVNSVTRFTYGTEGEVIDRNIYTAIKTRQRPGASSDTLVYNNGACWTPGRYEVEAIWGISADEITADIERTVLRYASALHQQSKSPASYLPPDEYGDFPHLIPYDVWEAIEREKLCDNILPVLM